MLEGLHMSGGRIRYLRDDGPRKPKFEPRTAAHRLKVLTLSQGLYPVMVLRATQSDAGASKTVMFDAGIDIDASCG